MIALAVVDIIQCRQENTPLVFIETCMKKQEGFTGRPSNEALAPHASNPLFDASQPTRPLALQ